MQRLSGLDASFAELDTPTAPLAVAMACTFDHTTSPTPYEFDRVRSTVADRLHLIPSFRRRLVRDPIGMDRPRWLEDPDFDLDNHLRRCPSALVDDAALANVTAQTLEQPLAGNRPLWDMTVVEAVEVPRSASVTRVHHAAIDGVAGAAALANFLDLEPTAASLPPEPWLPETTPSPVALAVEAIRSSVRSPVRQARRIGNVAAAGVRLIRHARSVRNDNAAPLPLTAPRTPFNGPLTPARAVAFARVGLADIATIREGVGGTVNDVLLALCSRSLRRYLHVRDALPTRPLVAAIPVSVHDAVDDVGANQVSGMLVQLPTDVDDCAEVLQQARANARAGKAQHDALGPTAVCDLAELTPTPLLRAVAALDQRIGLSSRLPPLSNVVISNFIGPSVPLYFAGARLDAAYPLGPLAFGTGLNITAQSYLDTLHIGVTACPDLVEDAGAIAGGIETAADELRRTARRATAVGAPPAR